jgi:pSer/pThr/pTyr-binding forkhead associated (FHA) protein
VDDANASRKHAELRYESDGSWTLIDLNSTNGTKVNGRLVGSITLKPDDRITVGTTEFIFSYE